MSDNKQTVEAFSMEIAAEIELYSDLRGQFVSLTRSLDKAVAKLKRRHFENSDPDFIRFAAAEAGACLALIAEGWGEMVPLEANATN